MWLILVFITLVFGVVAGGYAWMVFQKLREGKIENDRIVELSTIIHRGAMASSGRPVRPAPRAHWLARAWAGRPR